MLAKDPENRPTAADILSMDIVGEKNKVSSVNRDKVSDNWG